MVSKLFIYVNLGKPGSHDMFVCFISSMMKEQKIKYKLFFFGTDFVLVLPDIDF